MTFSSSDYNYEPLSDGSCGLVQEAPKIDRMAVCNDPDVVEWWEATGYRRIPLTTCTGGLNLDHLVSRPCPNKDKEYQQKHGISGIALFFAIVSPIAVAIAAGYYVYTRWNGKFGEIRLGEESSSLTGGGLFSRESALLTVPVAIVAGTVAVAKTLPLLMSSLWRSVSGFFTRRGRRSGGAGVGGGRPYSSRASFARRGDYASVLEDEDELLGVDDGAEEEGEDDGELLGVDDGLHDGEGEERR